VVVSPWRCALRTLPAVCHLVLARLWGNRSCPACAAPASYTLGVIHVADPLSETPLLRNRGFCDRARERFFRIRAGITWYNLGITACGWPYRFGGAPYTLYRLSVVWVLARRGEATVAAPVSYALGETYGIACYV
jgi:hypothetical protein